MALALLARDALEVGHVRRGHGTADDLDAINARHVRACLIVLDEHLNHN